MSAFNDNREHGEIFFHSLSFPTKENGSAHGILDRLIEFIKTEIFNFY